MAGVTADTIGIDIVTRQDRLASGLRTAEQRVDQSARKMDRSISAVGSLRSASRFGRAALGGFGAFAVAGGLASIASAGASKESRNTFSALLEGDFRKAGRSAAELHDKLKELPFGIGLVSRAFEDLANTLYGIDDGVARDDAARKRTLHNESARDVFFERERQLLRLQASFQGPMQEMQVEKTLADAQTNADSTERRMNGVDLALDTQIISLERQIAALEFEKRRDEMRGPAFDVFNTVLGQFKSGATSSEQQTAKEKTAKKTADNTRRTAVATERVASLLANSNSGIVVFN